MSNLQKYVTEEEKSGWQTPEIQRFLKNTEQGAATTVYAAISRDWEGKGGKYLEDCRVATSDNIVETMVGVKPYAYDENKENRLWELTRKLVGLE